METPETTPKQTPAPRRSWFRRIFLLLPVTAGIAAVFYSFENWRGNRAWKKYEQEVKARGLPLDWRKDLPKPSLAPQPIGTEESRNFCKNFDLANQLMTNSVHDRQFEDLVAWAQALTALKSGKTPDALKAEGIKIETGKLTESERASVAPVVLQIFEDDKAYLDKVRAQCHRPNPLYPFEGDPVTGPSMFPRCPRVFEAINLARMLRVKASAELAAGNTAAALKDLDLTVCVSESFRTTYPYLISSIGRVACLAIGLRFPWEGLAARQFTDSELNQIQQMLGSDNLVPNFRRVCLCERALTLPFFDGMLEGPKARQQIGVDAGILSIIPSGWVKLDELNYAQFYDSMLVAGLPESGKRSICPKQLDKAWERIHEQVAANEIRKLLKHTFLTSYLMPKLTAFFVTASAAQVTTDQTRLACGLERYYLKHRNYPEKLQQIAPEFLVELPSDPISGEPYGYAQEPNGRYKIWSVGWNEKDDGGTRGASLFDEKAGDWVWRYP